MDSTIHIRSHALPATADKPGDNLPSQEPGAPTAEPAVSQGANPHGSNMDNLLLNRELSWIQFNRRVLEEALDPGQPLLERLKFLSIFSTNLDEFFMVRVSGLQEQMEADPMHLSPDGLSTTSQLRQISEQLRPLLDAQMRCLREEILPGLEQHGVRIVPYARLTDEQRAEIRQYFYDRVYPVLTPLAVDTSHPFPYISNISLNLGILVAPRNPDPGEEEPKFARVKLPPNVPRLIPVGEGYTFILLEEIVAAHIESLFPGMEVLECQPFRITRDADIEIEEDEAGDLLKSVERQLRKRRLGFCVRLEIATGMSAHMQGVLRRSLELEEQDVYATLGLVHIPDLMALYKLDLAELKDKPFAALIPPQLRTGDHLTDHIFDTIRYQDILLHHPYESFAPVVEFLRQAARDPNVLAIKQTLYRVGKDSPVVQALIDAAENGKQVVVLVELKARFDEENNIIWARRLEKAGAHVVYGVQGLKTHAKATLVLRQEGHMLRRYVHLGTGNYNPLTARTYTDLGLLTCDPDFGADVTELFNYLTGYSRQDTWRKLMVAPVNMRQRLTAMIRREARNHQAGRPAGIDAKCNSLTDTDLIQELIEASRAGVPIRLLVRGISCLRPGVPGHSDTIRIGSVVGRFLEHTRVYRFVNGGNEEVYLGSADLMNRNLDRRVELMFPLQDERIRQRVSREVLELGFADNVKMRWLQSDGSYVRATPDEIIHDFQSSLLATPGG